MPNNEIAIRPVRLTDAPALADVYRPYVLESSVSFELDPPTADEFAERIERTTATHPWFVATADDVAIGYAYGCTHRARAAYRFSVETSVYLSSAFHRQGIAGRLYATLFEELRARNFCQAYAGITLPNEASVAFHQQFGFAPIGVFPSIGFKFDQWHDVAWFHRPLSGENKPNEDG